MKIVLIMKEKPLIVAFLCGIFLFQSGFVPQLDDHFMLTAVAQNEDADFEEEDDFFDEEETDDETDEVADDATDEVADDADEENADDEDFSEDDDSDAPKKSKRLDTKVSDADAEVDIMLEEYESDALYATKKYEYGDASIREILASNPTTVMELVKAARDFTSLKRYALANRFYKMALNAEPTEDDVTALVTEYGRAFFVTLSENALLEPDGTAFGKSILQALENRYSSDPEFIQLMIEQLFSSDERERKVAETELLTYRSVSLPALIDAYAENDNEEEKTVLQNTLLMFGDGLTSAATACIESEKESLQLAAVDLLKFQAKNTTPEAVLMLFYASARDGKNAEIVQNAAKTALKELSGKEMTNLFLGRTLELQIEKLQSDKEKIESAGNDSVIEVIWRWHAEQDAIVPTTASRLTKYRLNSYRLAQAFWNLYPESVKARKYIFLTSSEYVTTFMDQFDENQLKTVQIMKTPEFERLVKNFKLAEIEGYLTECLNAQFYDAGVMAVLAMGELGDATLLQPVTARNGASIKDPTLLVTSTQSYSPLVCALHVPNRLLRFATLQTVMKLDPQTAFPGSSRVVDTLAWFMSTDGHSKVLVGDLTEAEAVRLGGRLNKHGFQFEIADSAKSILEKAVRYCDFTMILLNVQMLSKNADLLLQQLMRDPRTADVPIVLLAGPEYYKTAELLARRIPKCVWFPEPASDDDLKLMLSVVDHVQTSVVISDDQRITETRAVLLWTRDIMRSHQGGWVQKLRFNSEKNTQNAKSQSILEDVKVAKTEPEDEPEDDVSTGDSELDALLEAGNDLPESTELASENTVQANPTADWDREPLQVYDITRLVTPIMRIYHNPDFLREALEVLRWSGTPEAQQALSFIGTSGTFSYSASRRAARIFRENTLRFGILMTTKEVEKLYDLYNDTPSKREKLLEVRGLVLDALEAPLDPESVPDVTLDTEVFPDDTPEENRADDAENDTENDAENDDSDDSEDVEDAEEAEHAEEEGEFEDEELESDEDEYEDEYEDEELESDELDTDELDAGELDADDLNADELDTLEAALDEELESL